MRKMVNISALVFFIWLVLGAFDFVSVFLNFLLVGELPGGHSSLSPSMMLAIMTTVSGIIVFELLARRFAVIRRTRQQLFAILSRYERLPHHRFNRI